MANQYPGSSFIKETEDNLNIGGFQNKHWVVSEREELDRTLNLIDAVDKKGTQDYLESEERFVFIQSQCDIFSNLPRSLMKRIVLNQIA